MPIRLLPALLHFLLLAVAYLGGAYCFSHHSLNATLRPAPVFLIYSPGATLAAYELWPTFVARLTLPTTIQVEVGYRAAVPKNSLTAPTM